MATILIVEDSPDNMKLFRTLLTLHGHDVIGQGSGDGLIQQIRDARPDLVLMDIQLPGMNGIQALHVLRENPDLATIPVIAVTASVMHEDRKQIMAAGFDAYCGKPLNLKEFLETVKQTLERGRA